MEFSDPPSDEIVARLAYSYSCNILLGCAAKPTEQANNASGFVVELDNRHFLFTAAHVLAGFSERAAREDHAHFQPGDVDLNPIRRFVHRDKSNDIAILALRPGEAERIVERVYRPIQGWPPPPPAVGRYAHLIGFPHIMRQNGDHGTIESTSLSLSVEIGAAHATYFSAPIEHHRLEPSPGYILPAPGAFLGGMSGGPALLLDENPVPIVGLVAELNPAFDLVRISNLASVPVSMDEWTHIDNLRRVV
jgi:hypothetical protein